MSDNTRSRLASLAVRLVIAGVVVSVLAMLIGRMGIVDGRLGFFGAAGGLLIVAVGVVLGLIGVIRGLMGKPGTGQAALAAILGVAILAFPISNALTNGSAPQIHDITTDLENPPEFVSAVALRGDDSNPLDRANPANLADLQREAYPQLQTLVVADDIATVFAAALDVANAQGWDVADADEPENGEPGRIEATDTTLLFGFQDDIVIRIADDGPERTLVDMRSVSRIGISDLGKNAARIDSYMQALQAKLGS
ncbi:hypothetical protein BN1012_Phect2334 [Candidatus Phaeomarinobacter ectocarpi]|uniref:DUF1499 domain-containing protein n=1 Tax=Candidatus Phaeomarinibacter ectocarpi TaxID=1458461 RepID=X5MDX4_9HYPH|nr:DUF1499 domain-containing protein [Candidatus Phaeomarinobacter ectocarpi]CDO60547.1 hypothetical protein BN1012_Phect2334 [Candidatus Phaeomarinobacter ectocarpi]